MREVCELDLYRESNFPHHIRVDYDNGPVDLALHSCRDMMRLFHSLVFSLPKTLLAFDILFTSSASMRPSLDMVLPRYVKLSTWSRAVRHPHGSPSHRGGYYLVGKVLQSFLCFFFYSHRFLDCMIFIGFLCAVTLRTVLLRLKR